MGYKRLDLLPPDSPLEPMFPRSLLPKEKPLKGGSVSTPIVLDLTYLSKAIFLRQSLGTFEANVREWHFVQHSQ